MRTIIGELNKKCNLNEIFSYRISLKAESGSSKQVEVSIYVSMYL